MKEFIEGDVRTATKRDIKRIEDGLEAFCISGGVHPESGPVLMLTFSKERAEVKGEAIHYIFTGTDILKLHEAVDRMVTAIVHEVVGMGASAGKSKSKCYH